MSRKYISRPPNSSSLFTNVLTAVRNLQEVFSNQDGITIDQIEAYMNRHFSFDGHIRSQIIQYAVNEAVRTDFLQKRTSGGYSLVYPITKIYMTKEEEARKHEVPYAKILYKSPEESSSLVRISTRSKASTSIVRIIPSVGSKAASTSQSVKRYRSTSSSHVDNTKSQNENNAPKIQRCKSKSKRSICKYPYVYSAYKKYNPFNKQNDK